MYVFVVQHAREMTEDVEDVKLIGIYSTEESAKAAIERLSLQHGFREATSSFHIDRYRVDEDQWTEGFVTVGSVRR